MSENIDPGSISGSQPFQRPFTNPKSAADEGGGNIHELNAWRHHLDMGEKGPKRNLTNLMVHLRFLPGLGKEIRFNELTGVADWRGHQIEEADLIDIQMIIERANFQPVKGDLSKAVARLALDNSYHPIREYLDGLTWDQRPRLDKFLHQYFGTPDTSYESMVGSKWMIGAVARVYEPGCKMDNMIVLEGAQNIGKSVGLATLFGRQYFGEMICELRDQKKFMEQSAGKWVLEFAELAALKRADIDYVKALITAQVDASRMSYGQVREDRPRRCVLAATVNPRPDAGYLTDSTGNRRFWPVRCSEIDLPKLTKGRDQIWAETVVRYRAGEQWWLDTGESGLAAAEQTERLAVDPWADLLVERLDPGQRYTAVRILTSLLKVAEDRLDNGMKTRLSGVMTGLGWSQHPGKVAGPDGVRRSVREWRKEG